MPSVHRQSAKGDQLAERAVHILTACANHRRQFSLRQPDADSHPTRHGFAVPAGEASAAVVLTVFAALPAQAAETRTFVGQKICRVPFVTVSPPNPGGYCLITQASLKVLLGAKDYYTNPTVTRTESGALAIVSSPVTIRAADKRHSTAQGHCTYYYPPTYAPGHGFCSFWSGTGRLEGFHARFAVGSPTPTGVSVVGPYWFDREHGNGDN